MRNHRSSKRSCRNSKKDEYPTIGVPPAAHNKDTNSAAQRKQPCGSSTVVMQDDGRNAMLLTKVQDRNKVKQTWAPAGRAIGEMPSGAAWQNCVKEGKGFTDCYFYFDEVDLSLMANFDDTAVNGMFRAAFGGRSCEPPTAWRHTFLLLRL